MVCTHVFLEKKKTTALFREQPNPRIAFADIGRTVDSGFIFIDVFDFERGVMYYHCFFCFLRTTSRWSRSFEFIFFCRETYSRDWQKGIFFCFFFLFSKMWWTVRNGRQTTTCCTDNKTPMRFVSREHCYTRIHRSHSADLRNP